MDGILEEVERICEVLNLRREVRDGLGGLLLEKGVLGVLKEGRRVLVEEDLGTCHG